MLSPWRCQHLTGRSEKSDSLNVILVQWQRQVAGKSSNTPLWIVDLMAANPFIFATGVAGELGVAFTTAQRAIELLESMEIAKLTTEAERDRIDCT